MMEVTLKLGGEGEMGSPKVMKKQLLECVSLQGKISVDSVVLLVFSEYLDPPNLILAK